MSVENPLLEPWLVPVQREIPVAGLLLDRLAAAEGRLRIEKFVRTESAAAFFALVTVSTFGTAFRTGPDYVTVSKKSPCLDIIILLAFLLNEFAFLIQSAEKLRCSLFMHFRSGPGIYVEIDAEPGK